MQSKIIISLTFLALIRFVFPNELNRIIKGHYASPKQFPYQTFIDKLDLSNLHGPIGWRRHCGGILISSNLVLTAAHCLDKPDIYAVKIYFGALNLWNVTEEGRQILVVKRDHFVIHNEWDTNLSVNDIALIKLPISLIFNDYIKAVQLPNPEVQYQFSEAISSGWGDVDDKGNMDPKLKYYNPQILSDRECEHWYKSSITSAFPASLICIAPNENRPCRGDSGSPLVIRQESNLVLLGITSFIIGENCGPSYPVLFTRVSSHLTWIRDNENQI
ncbi:chymotrypsin BI-like [Drosophila santomea]|uniref:chymotrypsin BI-like n=1 Tax=Drosophila santomea TaxID=129105 RepID=UPI001953EB70|nr:chymotrypsin BI-like [Drosophila santomea]